jgi:hypothetical protein
LKGYQDSLRTQRIAGSATQNCQNPGPIYFGEIATDFSLHVWDDDAAADDDDTDELMPFIVMLRHQSCIITITMPNRA